MKVGDIVIQTGANLAGRGEIVSPDGGNGRLVVLWFEDKDQDPYTTRHFPKELEIVDAPDVRTRRALEQIIEELEDEF